MSHTTELNTESAIASCYSTWGEAYHEEYYGAKAVYPPVHKDLLLKLLGEHKPRRVLDAGCGSASFLRYLAGQGLELYGFDLTPEMVSEAQKIMAARNEDPNRIWLGSVGDAAAYVAPSGPVPYDALVCSGVMPHISEAIEDTVFAHMYNALAPGGLVLVEARNELFSLFTHNRHTADFFRNQLIQEQTLLACAGEQAEALQAELNTFVSRMRLDLPPVRAGKQGEAGYDEVLSRLHNPFTLPHKLQAAGFKNVQVHFYHFHCLPPMLRDSAPEFFRAQSLAMEDPNDWRGHFMASAFILSAMRPL